MMIRFAILTLLLLQAWSCASFDEPSEAPDSKALTVICRNNVEPALPVFQWRLQVDPDTIHSNSRFATELTGTMFFEENILDRALELLGAGFREVNLVDGRATVHVRAGASGEDVTLELAPVPYQCAADRASCDPANDLEGVPGLRGNTDCEPVGPTNVCGRFLAVPTSSDCEPGGLCARLGKTDQCLSRQFCITGDLSVRLQSVMAQYTADTEGQVLFGWDDENTGATLGEDGVWSLPPAVYGEPTGPNGFRLTAGIVPLAFECTMGTFDDQVPPQPIRTPDSDLISFAIEPVP